MPSRSRLLAVAAVAAAAATSTGCGGGSHAGPTDRASASPQEIIKQSAAALGRIHSYSLNGVDVDANGRTKISLDVTDGGAMRGSYRGGGDGDFAFVVYGTATYVKGDRSYWEDGASPRGRRLASRLAGRWVKVPRSIGVKLQDDVKRLLPTRQSQCLSHHLGTLTVDGTRTYRGRKVIVVRDAGDKPGTTDSELWVPATGPALPVRELTHARTRPGGTFDPACDDPTPDTATRSSTRIDDFDAVRPIRPPKDPLDLQPARPGSGRLA